MIGQQLRNSHEVSPGLLRTVFPTIHFKKGPWTKKSKRAIRIFRNTLCVSAQGKLLAVEPTGPKTCVCDLRQVPLFDFGSACEARRRAQLVAPAATFESLGLERKNTRSQNREVPNDNADSPVAVSGERASVISTYLL